MSPSHSLQQIRTSFFPEEILLFGSQEYHFSSVDDTEASSVDNTNCQKKRWNTQESAENLFFSSQKFSAL